MKSGRIIGIAIASVIVFFMGMCMGGSIRVRQEEYAREAKKEIIKEVPIEVVKEVPSGYEYDEDITNLYHKVGVLEGEIQAILEQRRE